MIVDGVETDVSRFTGTRTRPGVVRFPLSLSFSRKKESRRIFVKIRTFSLLYCAFCTIFVKITS